MNRRYGPTALGVALGLLCVGAGVTPAGAQLAFPGAATTDRAKLDAEMPRLAKAILRSYREPDRARYLDAAFRLQIVAGDFDAANESLSALREIRWPGWSDAGAAYVPYQVYLQARIATATGSTSFDAAFQRAFRERIGALDDRTSALVVRSFGLSVAGPQTDLQSDLDRQRGENEISVRNALALVRAYQLAEMFAATAHLTPPLVAADDRRRYLVERDVQVATGDGATVCTLIVRPRTGAGRLPTLLEFTIYADRLANYSEARQTAANGYAGVVGLTRGAGCSPGHVVPYEYDGSDASALIAWIARQPWSDGRVGMFGGSYNSFAQWAAAKHVPPALKALMPSVSNAPGIDAPMERNVFQSFSYQWPFYVTAGKWLDASSEGDPARWVAMENKWYVSGAPYRSMDKIDGTPNPIWDDWLDHPSYDAYWQRLVPFRGEFARIHIPVLTTDGYLAGQDVGGYYYFAQYHRYVPDAENYLLIGPYDHIRAQRGTVTMLGGSIDSIAGYPLDAAAHIDIPHLRYEWFDHIFKGAPRPAILQDKVNYEVMGANRWKHASSVETMHNAVTRFYLSPERKDDLHRLSEAKPSGDAFVDQSVDFADRSDVNRIPPSTGLDSYLGVAFVSPPFQTSFDLSGLFSGRLDFVTNKKDVDFNVGLYLLTRTGEYTAVTYYMARASYVRDPSRRMLLVPGVREQLDFVSSRLTSWAFPAGSRLVVLLSIVKEPDIQINYGTGGDVSDESIADAKEPLRIKWFGDSFVEIPVWR